MGFGKVGLEPDGFLEVADGRVDRASACQDNPEVVVRDRVPRIKPERFPQIVGGASVVAFLHQEHTQSAVGKRITDIQPERFTELIHRFVKTPLFTQGPA